MIYDVIIVGCGPAGMSAAIYAKRSNLNVLVLEKEAPGGKVMNLDKVDNYLGFNNVNGIDLALSMFEHFNKFNIELRTQKVEKISIENSIFKVQTQDEIYESKTVIMATGLSSHRKLYKGEKEYINKGICYCAICDGALYKNKVVAYIGEENIDRDLAYLSNLCSKVIYLGNAQIGNYENVEQIKDPTIKEFVGHDKVEKVILADKEIEVSGVFIESSLNSSNVTIEDINMQNNFIVVTSEMQTNIPGLFAAGDNNVKTLRQISTAISDGAIAATSALKYIKK